MKPAGLAIMIIGFFMHFSPFVMLFSGAVVLQAASALILSLLLIMCSYIKFLTVFGAKGRFTLVLWFENLIL